MLYLTATVILLWRRPRIRRVHCCTWPSRCHTVYNVPAAWGDLCRPEPRFPGTDVARRDLRGGEGIEEW